MSAIERATLIAMVFMGMVGCWGFCVRYAIKYRPFATEMGAHLFLFSASLGSILTFQFTLFFWPSMPVWLRVVLRFTFFGSAIVCMWWRWFILEATVRRDRLDYANNTGGNA